MKSHCLIMLSVAVWLVSSVSATAQQLAGLGEHGAVTKIQGGFQFVEGPAQTPDGSIYFTDIPANIIHRLTLDGKIEVFIEPSAHANGLMYGGQDRLLACQMDGQLVSIDLTSKQITTLADKYQGNRFNACNDLVIDKLGGIYFTDPRYNAPDPWPQEKEAFYYRSADGDVARLGDNLTAPNGIGLSPDEKTLYVIPSMGSEMMAYEVKQPGVLGTGRVLCRLQQVGDATNGGGDGMALDVQGNLYITSSAGIQVFSPAGKLLGIIAVPETPANCAFGGEDRKTLFITARTSLYRCTVPVAGLIPRSE
ncbi:MAG: SMP-30/gluconolactonase/LRE family protein [Pirellulaceae bacterium]|jgi:gluconolactonase|nr:SMP-30/gluconolactonase/LRE family protein [Pirellulaceae bacterium]